MISKKTLYLLTLAVASTLSAQTAPKSTAQKSTAAPKSTAARSTESKSTASKSGASIINREITAVLDKQTECWNRGDTDGFLAGYAPDAVFISDVVTRGLDQLRERYQSHYPTRVSMGILTFSDIEVHSLDAAHAFVIGHYHLQRAPEGGGDAGGVFSLLFKRTAQGWKIEFDHTT